MDQVMGKFFYAFVVVFLVIAPIAGFCSYIERKVSAAMQYRKGPNRVGPGGLLQFFADAIKMFLKEDTAAKNADRFLFALAPSLVGAGALGAFASVPFARDLVGANLDVGILFVVAVGSLVSLGIMLGSWASDSKWSLIGGVRAAAQLVSYEIPLGIALLCVVTHVGSTNLMSIAESQATMWNVFQTPFLALAFVIYFISSLAECNRAPFDLPEAESELVSGFNTEFSGIRFAMYALGEFADVLLFASVATVVFLGGWHLPFLEVSSPWIGVFVFTIKVFALVFVVMWTRWTLPRLRVDQLMSLCWKYLIPFGLFSLVGSMVWVWIFS